MPVEQPTAQRLPLLLEDPELAVGVPPSERTIAERSVTVPLHEQGAGVLDVHAILEEPTLGMVVLSGFVYSCTIFSGHVSEQILGPGDVVQRAPQGQSLLPVQHEHRVLGTVRLAILDRRFIAAVRKWPGLLMALHERMREQGRQLAIHTTIGHLRRAEDRVLALLWQLAERWGRVTSAGVTVPLRLTHAELGRLVGASRPTVSIALGELEAGGHVTRHGTQMLLSIGSSDALGAVGGGPRTTTTKGPTRSAQRPTDERPMASLPLVTDPPPRGLIDREALSARVAALHEAFEGHQRTVDAALEAARTSVATSSETRDRLRAGRARGKG